MFICIEIDTVLVLVLKKVTVSSTALVSPYQYCLHKESPPLSRLPLHLNPTIVLSAAVTQPRRPLQRAQSPCLVHTGG